MSPLSDYLHHYRDSPGLCCPDRGKADYTGPEPETVKWTLRIEPCHSGQPLMIRADPMSLCKWQIDIIDTLFPPQEPRMTATLFLRVLLPDSPNPTEAHIDRDFFEVEPRTGDLLSTVLGPQVIRSRTITEEDEHVYLEIGPEGGIALDSTQVIALVQDGWEIATPEPKDAA